MPRPATRSDTEERYQERPLWVEAIREGFLEEVKLVWY